MCLEDMGGWVYTGTRVSGGHGVLDVHREMK